MVKSILIDVRSPEEYSTGFLPLAINIEYTSISNLPAIIPDINQDSNITLYCRSGRRSAIALHTLQAMGFTNVRDIGAYEVAERILRLEAAGAEVSKPEQPVKTSTLSKEELDGSVDRLLAGLREVS